MVLDLIENGNKITKPIIRNRMTGVVLVLVLYFSKKEKLNLPLLMPEFRCGVETVDLRCYCNMLVVTTWCHS